MLDLVLIPEYINLICTTTPTGDIILSDPRFTNIVMSYNMYKSHLASMRQNGNPVNTPILKPLLSLSHLNTSQNSSCGFHSGRKNFNSGLLT